MKTLFCIASTLALAAAMPAAAQISAANTGTMAPADVGVSPLMGTSATDYVKMAADSDMYEIASGKLALQKSRRDDVKGLAREMIADHMTTTKSLMAALDNKDRKIAKPSPRMSAANDAKLALLKKAPRANFDNLYLQQQAEAHQSAWALHKGYATDGTDPALMQVASTAVPVIERHLAHVKSLMSSDMSGGQ